MSDAIEGNVAAIVSVREVAINRGQKDGVTEGMVFAILAESPMKITDPVSNQVLGELDREKVRVKVSEVREGYSLASTYQTTGGFIGFDALDLFQGRRTRTLKVEDSELPSPLPEDKSYVKRGDRVRQVGEVPLD